MQERLNISTEMVGATQMGKSLRVFTYGEVVTKERKRKQTAAVVSGLMGVAGAVVPIVPAVSMANVAGFTSGARALQSDAQ